MMFKLPALLFLLIASPLLADPWGKDADLAYSKKQTLQGSPRKSLLTSFGEKAIRFHQEVISPADGPRSHFVPSSSQYTLEAMRKHGFFQGYLMGCDRLMRENEDDWVYLKARGPHGILNWDPVK